MWLRSVSLERARPQPRVCFSRVRCALRAETAHAAGPAPLWGGPFRFSCPRLLLCGFSTKNCLLTPARRKLRDSEVYKAGAADARKGFWQSWGRGHSPSLPDSPPAQVTPKHEDKIKQESGNSSRSRPLWASKDATKNVERPPQKGRKRRANQVPDKGPGSEFTKNQNSAKYLTTKRAKDGTRTPAKRDPQRARKEGRHHGHQGNANENRTRCRRGRWAPTDVPRGPRSSAKPRENREDGPNGRPSDRPSTPSKMCVYP